MLDEDILINAIIDRYTAEELCEELGLDVRDIVMAFYEKCLEIECD